jgi:hypothetical protein
MSNIKGLLEKFKTSNAKKKSMIGIAIDIFMGLMVAILISKIYSITNRNKKNCNTINSLYPNFPKVASIGSNPNNSTYQLRDYYIKTAYNACSAGTFKNDFVNICALKSVIKQGARCLDFEIYSLNNKPVVATSSTTGYYTKETYNSINLAEVLSTINNYAFSNSTCPNPNDPLILNFRIMSNNRIMYDEMAKIIGMTLVPRLLDKESSHENGGTNIGLKPITELSGKIIIMVDRSNPLFQQTKLDEYVNAASGSAFMRSYTYDRVKNIQDMAELTEFNRNNMTIVLPNRTKSCDNPSLALTQVYGCQMTAMSFQCLDDNMKYYNKMFDDAGTAFILKPENLRSKTVVANIPPPPSQALAQTPKEMSAPGVGTITI